MKRFRWIGFAAFALTGAQATHALAEAGNCSTTEVATDAGSLADAVNCANSNGADTTIQVQNSIDITGATLPALNGSTLTTITGSPITSTTATGQTDLQQSGEGTTLLNTTGLSAYAGRTLVNGGTLQAGAKNAFAPLSDYKIDHPGILDLNGYDQTIGSLSGDGAVTLGAATLTVGRSGQSVTFSGTISGAGGLTLDPSLGYTRTLTTDERSVNFTLEGTQTYQGATRINVGFLALDSGASVAGPIIINTGIAPNGDTYGGTLVVEGSAGAVTLNNAISGAGGIAIAGEQATFAGDLSGYTGRVQIDGSTDAPGAFIVGANSFGNNAVNVIIDQNGTFDVNGHAVTVQIIGDGTSFGQNPDNIGTILLNGGALTVANGGLDYYAGTIQDGATPGGSLVKTGGGTLQLLGANTYTGGTTIEGGIVQFSNSDNTGKTVNSSSVGTGAVTLNGGTLQAQGNFVQIANAIHLGAVGGTIDTAGGFLNITGNITDAAPGAGPLTFVNSGAQGYTLQLSGTNTFTGGAIVTARVNIGLHAPNAIGAGSLEIDAGGSVDLASYDQTVTVLTGSGYVINSGVNSPPNGTVTNTLTVSSGTYAGGLYDGSGSSSVNDVPVTFNGILNLAKVSDGILTLSGFSGYSGTTSVEAGTLQAGSTTAFSASSAFTVANGATLDLHGFDNTVASLAGTGTVTNQGTALATLTTGGGNTSSVFAGTLSDGSAALGLAKAGTGTLTLSGTSSYSGPTTVQAGTLLAGSVNGFSPNSNAEVDNGATLDLGGFSSRIGGLSGAGIVTNSGPNGVGLTVGQSGASTEFDGVIQDGAAPLGLTKVGAGTLILTGTNSYTGTTSTGLAVPVSTTISAGTLQIGNGGTTGSILGNVEDNAVLAFDRSDRVVLASTLVGSGSLQQLGSGTLVLTGTNATTGPTTISAGTLQIGDGGTAGSVAGPIVDNATLAFDRADAVSFGQVILGSGAVVQSGAGDLRLTGANTFSGGLVLTAGRFVAMADQNLGAAGNAITLDGGTFVYGSAFDIAASHAITLGQTGGRIDVAGGRHTIGSAIGGTGLLTILDSTAQPGARLDLTGANTYAGGTALKFGTLGVGSDTALGTGTLSMTSGTTLAFLGNYSLANPIRFVGTGDPTIDTGPNTDTLSGPISGADALTKIGTGTLDLTGANTYTGATTVAQGMLLVDGSIANSATTVQSGASIGGRGRIGSLTVDGGGTLAPGAGVPYSTLAVGGNLTMQAGSTFRVGINAAGRTDTVAVAGTSTLNGGTVDVRVADGIYSPSSSYTILSAAGGMTGRFTGLTATSNLAFLTPTLTYTPTAVDLTLVRPSSAVTFPSVATTLNTRNTAAAIEAIGSGPLFDAVLSQTVAGARQAFRSASGEAHASATTTALQSTRLVSGIVFDRLWNIAGSGGDDALSAIDQFNSTTLPTLLRCYAPDAGGASTPAGEIPSHYSVWGQAIGDFGRSGGDGNAATVDRTLGGFALGADTRVDAKGFDNWRVGVTGGYTNSQFGVHDGGGSGTYETAFGGLYAGARYGALDIRLGATYGASSTNVHRAVAFPGFYEAERSSYDGDTIQGFGEIGYRFAFGKAVVEPVLDGSITHVHQDGYREKGGAASLVGLSQDIDVGSTVLGVRAEATPFATVPVVARLFLGWQHAYGDVNPAATVAFTAGAQSFAVYGAPVDRNAAVAEAGFDWRATGALTLGVSYVGRAGPRDHDNAIKGQAQYRF